MLETVEQLRQLLSFVEVASEEERTYVRRWLVHHHEQETWSLFHRFGLVFNVFGLATTPLGTPELQHDRYAYHLTLIALCSVWLLWVRRRPQLGRLFTLATGYVYLVPFAAMMVMRLRLEAWTFDTVAMASVFLAMGSFLALLSPYRGRWLPVLALSYLGIGAYAVHDHPGAPVWLVTFTIALGGALLYCHAIDNAHRRQAITEFRARLMVAPRSVVNAFFGSTDELARVFRPAQRPCVCLSVDSKSDGAADDPSVLARLDAFYAHCDRTLRQAIKDGNYYTDWIAGELFVVVFGTTEADVDRSADQVLGAACQIAGHGDATARVVVGVASGLAHIGMMGPTGCRKATAIGEVAGRARRLISAPRPAGAKDGVVLGEEFRVRLGESWWLEELLLDASERPRDVGDGPLYGLTPVASLAQREAS